MHRSRRVFVVHGSHHLTDHAISGDGLVAWGFIQELARRGHRINVATDRLDVVGSIPANLTLVEFPRTHANRIEFLQHGVDVELFNPKASSADPPARGTTVLYVGSISRNKGVLTLVDAMARVIDRVGSATLVMVGDGPFSGELKSRLAQLRIADRVRFVGSATRAEVAAWMRSCDVLCAPSFGEPYGQNVLEAMASAKPIVITTAGGHKYIGDDHGALFFEPGNVEQLASALVTILREPALAAAMGRHNRAVANDHRRDEAVAEKPAVSGSNPNAVALRIG